MFACACAPPLQPGDELWAIAPSGALRELTACQAGVDLWRAEGYRVKLVTGFDAQWGYLAGTDGHRRQLLQAALADPACKGILCVRGGYGGTRLLETWQWPPIAPKWLIGFSDITSLLWSLSRQGIAGVHGPLLTTLAQEPEWSRHRLFAWVRGQAIPPLQGTGWGGGRVTGRLLPANLTVATHLLGTAHEPDLTGAILAIEDVTEAPYRLDRLLTQWRMLGKFEAIAGIAIGRFSRCEAPAGAASFTVAEVLRDRLGDLGLPVVADLPFGHDGVNAALPVGVMATLDATAGTLSLVADTQAAPP